MPEGPELYLSAKFVNLICKERVFSGKILKSSVSRQPDIDWNEESYIISAASRGKELKLTLTAISQLPKKSKKLTNNTLDIVFQFGMSGKFSFYEASELQKHAHLNFFTKTNTSDDTKMVLSFVDYRRFGKWQPGGDWSLERGPCVITEYSLFRENVLKNIDSTVFNKAICEVLLNQKYFNGIGNYLRAEICYRGGVKPFQYARSVLEPLLIEDKVKLEKPDILQLCHILPNEVINLGGTGYDPENRDPDYSKFTEWLQCYYKDGMKNIADHNKRTMWYSGELGPLAPTGGQQRKRVKKNSSKTKKEIEDHKEDEIKETVKEESKEIASCDKSGKPLTRKTLSDTEKKQKTRLKTKSTGILMDIIQETVKEESIEKSCDKSGKPLTRQVLSKEENKRKTRLKRKSTERFIVKNGKTPKVIQSRDNKEIDCSQCRNGSNAETRKSKRSCKKSQ